MFVMLSLGSICVGSRLYRVCAPFLGAFGTPPNGCPKPYTLQSGQILDLHWSAQEILNSKGPRYRIMKNWVLGITVRLAVVQILLIRKHWGPQKEVRGSSMTFS